jgi:leucyl-tRNA synthetase
MADVGLVHEREPFKRLFNQGQILGADGERMSKSAATSRTPTSWSRATAPTRSASS